MKPALTQILRCLLLLSLSLPLRAQDKAGVFGSVKDASGQALEWVNIAVEGQPGGTSTDRFGYFELEVPAGQPLHLLFSFVGFRSERLPLQLAPGESRTLRVVLQPQSSDLPGFTVIDRRISKISLTRVDPRLVSVIPSAGGGVEALLKTLPGVASNNELSSQYSVRGGNYDENLVYVNDVEIYRPFLVRSGQQEGLSFVNSDLVSSILFSAGGFEARYGDKMSSVLDIRYRKPTRSAGSAMLSLLGASLHLEGTASRDRFTYMMGLRQKSNQFLLRNLETSGQYRPSFTDVQLSLTYDCRPGLEISFLG
ncbi:MAG TPA: carboxypeptidase-like regulatory domain-containing protein, partial [Bacteroidales bacterium]|nr:carboxypeptidase-like regulatory domain-containing protein [Bacteroidales bacterium]